MLGVINATESLVEEIIETLMNAICLAHHNCVAFDCRVTNGCNCVNLHKRYEIKLCEQAQHVQICKNESAKKQRNKNCTYTYIPSLQLYFRAH